MNNKNAIVLTSGGLDSTTVLAMAKDQGYSLYCLSFDYGQRHRFELEAARKVVQFFNVKKHLILTIDLTTIGGSALTADIKMPKKRNTDQMELGIPVTYVPARNTIFLSYALAWAETMAAEHIFIGVNAVDYSGYPDCRPAFIEAFTQLANVATKAGVEGGQFSIHAPLIEMSKADIIREGIRLGVDYSKTVSCYAADEAGRACGVCDACRLRAAGFRDAGVPDSTRYQPRH